MLTRFTTYRCVPKRRHGMCNTTLPKLRLRFLHKWWDAGTRILAECRTWTSVNSKIANKWGLCKPPTATQLSALFRSPLPLDDVWSFQCAAGWMSGGLTLQPVWLLLCPHKRLRGTNHTVIIIFFIIFIIFTLITLIIMITALPQAPPPERADWQDCF